MLDTLQYFLALGDGTRQVLKFISEHSFEEIMTEVCSPLVEFGIGIKNEQISESLFAILNIQPAVQDVRERTSTLRSLFTTDSLSYKRAISQRTISSFKALLPTVDGLSNLYYGEAEDIIAHMHFNGNLGNGDSVIGELKTIGSQAVREFKFDEYLQIRATASFEGLYKLECVRTKLWLLYILVGFYISWFYDFMMKELAAAEIIVLLPHNLEKGKDIGKKMRFVINSLSGSSEAQSTFDTTIRKPLSMQEKYSVLDKFCTSDFSDIKKRDKAIDTLDYIGSVYHIGTRACNKSLFAQICFLIMTKTDLMKKQLFSECQRALAYYYRVMPSSYKVNMVEQEAKALLEKDNTLSNVLGTLRLSK